MQLLSRLLTPLRLAVVAFFRHDIALRRSKAGIKVVLEERQPKVLGRAATAPDPELAKLRREAAVMVLELQQLLQENGAARQTTRHLAFVNQALAKRGLTALDELPVNVLRKALHQFEGLVSNWAPVGLAALRSKMAVAVMKREAIPLECHVDASPPSGVMDSGLGVPGLPEVEVRSDDEALAAAYAALGSLSPASGIGIGIDSERQGEPGSPSARTLAEQAIKTAAATDDLKFKAQQA